MGGLLVAVHEFSTSGGRARRPFGSWGERALMDEKRTASPARHGEAITAKFSDNSLEVEKQQPKRRGKKRT